MAVLQVYHAQSLFEGLPKEEGLKAGFEDLGGRGRSQLIWEGVPEARGEWAEGSVSHCSETCAGDVEKRSVAGAERAGRCLGMNEVTEVFWALSIQGSVREEQNLELDPVVDWEPV